MRYRPNSESRNPESAALEGIPLAYRAYDDSARRRLFHYLLVPACLVLLAAAALPLDLPLSQACLNAKLPGDIKDLITFGEMFGHGLGVAMIAIVVFVLDPPRRYALPRVLLCAYGSGMAANAVKLLLTRTRPRHFEFDGGVMTTFVEWFPQLTISPVHQGFPSAHTATAVGFAVGLAALYPRGRILFGVLAAVVACQRIQSGAHFLSDTLCGVAVGWLIAGACLYVGRLPRWLDRLEIRLGASNPAEAHSA